MTWFSSMKKYKNIYSKELTAKVAIIRKLIWSHCSWKKNVRFFFDGMNLKSFVSFKCFTPIFLASFNSHFWSIMALPTLGSFRFQKLMNMPRQLVNKCLNTVVKERKKRDFLLCGVQNYLGSWRNWIIPTKQTSKIREH